jgi:hypothetical protein
MLMANPSNLLAAKRVARGRLSQAGLAAKVRALGVPMTRNRVAHIELELLNATRTEADAFARVLSPLVVTELGRPRPVTVASLKLSLDPRGATVGRPPARSRSGVAA